MAGFSVNIGANIAPLSAGLQQATAEVQKFSDVVATAAPTSSLTTLNNVISVTAHQFDELAASAAALAKIEAAIDQAAEAATNAGARFDTLGGRLPLQEFNTFKASVDRLKTDISGGLVPQISRIPAALNPITPAANNAGAALSKIKPGANQAANALQGVGRVAQDLPFGFIGIQNNLNPLLESFQRLKAETGSSSAALKALGSSLIGPAGIGIALSVISSAILIYQNGIAGFNSKTKEAKDKAEEFAKTLKTVADVIGDATSGQAGGIAQVQALANVVTDTNAAYGERKRALQDLQQINKSYFGDLKLEDDLLDKLKSRVDEYTKAIVAQAVVKGFADEISRVSVELAKQDRVLKGSTDEVNRLRTALANTSQSETSLTGEDRISRKYINTKNALDGANKAFTAQLGVVAKLRSNMDDLNDSIDGAVKETLKFRDLNNPEKQKAEVDLLKKRLEALEKIKALTKDATALVGIQESIFELQVKIAVRDQGKNQLTKQELNQQIKGFRDQLNEAFKNQAISLEAITVSTRGFKLAFSPTARVEIPPNIDDKVSKATGFDKKIPILTIQKARIDILGFKKGNIVNKTEEIVKDLNKEITKTIQQGLGDAFAGIGESFGAALSSGDFGEGLRSAAKSILGILGGVLQQIGRQVITAALAIKALKATLEKWAIANPGIAVAAGIGLVILGSALKNIKFDGPKFAQGGIISSPVIGQIGEMHRPEVIMPLDRLPQILKSMGGIGGGDMQLIPIINNEGLYLAVQRGGRRVNRKN